jgi:magnesium chelatase family protein
MAITAAPFGAGYDPAKDLLAAAMNPSPCGFHNDRTRECHCTPPMIQLARFSGSRQKLYCNAQLPPQLIRKFCELSADCERLLERAMAQQGLSARAHDRILKVARTIADLDGIPQLEPKHIAEAIQYRTLDRTFWA